MTAMNGINCFFEGARLVRQPGLRQYVIVPLIINIVVLGVIMAYGISQYDTWMLVLTEWLPDWLQFLAWLIGLLAAIVIFAVGIYCFSFLANVIASPFNAILSEKVEEQLVPGLNHPRINLAVVLTRAVTREFGKLLYFLPRFLGLLLLSVIPGLNAVAPFAWIIFGAWMMAVQYTDYAADNNQVSFSELRKRLEDRPMQALLFGLIVYFVIVIPVINLVLIPVAVAGGTVYWVEQLRIASSRM
jgi:CysZ protein